MSLVGSNFDTIKTSLKDYLKSKPDFKDYNFEGSVINTLIDLLAYNAYQSAYRLNMVGNEMFLDSATLKESVVSKAKLLGYTPKSKKSSRADIMITVYPDDDSNQLTIPKYSKFVSQVDGVNYYFYNLHEVIISPDNSGSFFTELTIFEGTPTTYTFDITSQNEKYVISDENIDTSLLTVYVKENPISINKVEYTLAEDITNLKANSKVYFLQMNTDGKYEIYFGNDVIGSSAPIGGTVTVETVVCRGSAPNGINTFRAKDHVVFSKTDNTKYYSNITISTINSSTNGEDGDDIEDIRFSAPKKFTYQNRVVIEEDYKNWLLSNFNDIESLSVWGGEKNTPPLFGKTVLAIKPKNGYFLSETRKSEIIYNLTKKNIMSIDPVIIDPIITFVKLTTNVRYDSRKTTSNANDLVNNVSQVLSNYEANALGKFESGFYTSPIIEDVKALSSAILDSTITFNLEKRLTPIINSNMSYSMEYNSSFYIPYSGYLGCLTSSGFKTDQYGESVVYLDDDGVGNVRIYTYDKSNKKYLNSKQGTIDYTNGIIELNSLKVTDIETSGENFIRIYVQPQDSFYVPAKNEVLLLSTPTVKLYDINTNSYIRNISFTTIGNNNILYTNYIKGSIV